jgi:hypothetical protein
MHVDYFDVAGQEQIYDLEESQGKKDKECNETTDRMAFYYRTTQSQLIAGEPPCGAPLSQNILRPRVQEKYLVLFTPQIACKIPDYGSYSSKLLVPWNGN